MSTDKDTAIAVRPETDAIALTPRQVENQVQLIQQVMKAVMQDGQHFGKIPGCGDKPALMKPGAEKLCLTFRMAPRFDKEIRDLGNGHREIQVTCELYHIETGKFLGEGVGSCSTLESKYRYRKAERKCPACGAESIIKGKQEYGGGWVCFAKKGGCGAKFGDGEKAIEDQLAGRTENPDIADTYNTVLKIAKKRAQVDAVLSATAASDIFTQDIEELGEIAAAPAKSDKPADSIPTKISLQQAQDLHAAARVKKITNEALLKQLGINRLGDLDLSKLQGAKTWIEMQSAPPASEQDIGKEYDTEVEFFIKAGVTMDTLHSYVELLPFAGDLGQVAQNLRQTRECFKTENLDAVIKSAIKKRKAESA